MHFIKTHKKICFLSLTFLLLSPFLFTRYHSYTANKNFEDYTDSIFIEDVSSNPLNLHYTLANPEAYGIHEMNYNLNSTSPATDIFLLYENRLKKLTDFSSEDLSDKNRLTKDILCLSYETELSSGNQSLLSEVLSPSLGIQAQLPILLAEYTFRTETDIQNYLKMLTSISAYFKEIIAFEQQKSAAGTFMSDTTADRIIQQCTSFIANPKQNYLDSIFQSNLENMNTLSAEKKQAYQTLHSKLIQEQVIPAYEMLINGLSELKGTGKNTGGLCNFVNGKSYYEYLLKSNCGLYESVTDIQERLLMQLETELNATEQLLSENPDLIQEFSSQKHQTTSSPEEMLETLQTKLLQDFPDISQVTYEIKYVHKDLEEYLSPAFYLTPPIDTLSPNTIYINSHEQLDDIQLFTTLAHEGFPGHLYQTIFFSSTNPSPIRHMVNAGGYVEGWATYVESYAYGYYDNYPELSRLVQKNRSLNLCILSLLDTKIHYDGWTLTNTKSYLSYFGITDSETQKEIYQIIVEDPANYLKYYMGYLHFLDLRDEMKELAGKNFSICDFHELVLEIGPCQFPILEQEVQKHFQKN